MIIARLVKKESDTAQATGQTAQPSATKKISNSGLRAVSPVRNKTTSLTGQHALNVALLPLSDWSDCHPKAIECARVLKVALTFIQRDPALPVSEDIGITLEPVLKMCTTLGRYTRQTVLQKTLSSNHANNNVDLHRAISERIEDVITDHPGCTHDVSIFELFSALHSEGVMPGPSTDAFAFLGFQARQIVLEQNEEPQFVFDSQKAIEESFTDVKRAMTSRIDQAQKEMQEGYVRDGGDLSMVM
jgi:hypothetical protein